jgi:NAD(P)-dependent dehydrogenase (short-subunit alcohol dehydrogenase family)
MSERKVAVVVGVGPGLGASVARRFAREGYALGLMARGMDKLTPVQTAITAAGGVALSVPSDATDAASVGAAFARMRESLGAPDVLVYNASAFRMASIVEVTPEMMRDCFDVSCVGALIAAREVLPDMVKRKRGTILLTGATASLRGSARFAPFAASKFALRALGQSMARELGPQGIHVAHVVVDGQIGAPGPSLRDASTMLAPDAIAETYWQLHTQDPTAWTFELDLRPSVEKF